MNSSQNESEWKQHKQSNAGERRSEDESSSDANEDDDDGAIEPPPPAAQTEPVDNASGGE